MQVTVNGEPRELAPGATLGDVVRAEGLDVARVAVEFDRVIVPREQLDSTLASEGSKVEIVHFVGGG